MCFTPCNNLINRIKLIITILAVAVDFCTLLFNLAAYRLRCIARIHLKCINLKNHLNMPPVATCD